MLPFLHDRLQKLQQLLERSNAVFFKYNQLDLDLALALTGFLDEAISLYRALNRTSTENELLALKAQFVSAEHGTHPLTLERITSPSARNDALDRVADLAAKRPAAAHRLRAGHSDAERGAKDNCVRSCCWQCRRV